MLSRWFDNEFLRALFDTGYRMDGNRVPCKKAQPGFEH